MFKKSIIILWGIKINIIKSNEKIVMPILQAHYHFKLDSQKMDQHTGGKWFIHGTKLCKDNQLQSL